MTSLVDFENLCTQLYNPHNSPLTPNEISAKLSGFREPEKIIQLKAIFQQSNNEFALLFAGQAMKDIISKKWNEIPKDEKERLRDFICILVGQKGHALPHIVKAEIYRVLGSIVKLGWFEDQSNRDLPERIKQYFIKPENPKLSILGLQMLEAIVLEINDKNSKHTLSQHRKVLTSFRDLALRPIFEAGIFVLKEVIRVNNNADVMTDLCLYALRLTRECLAFDFVGIFPHESTDDLAVVQIPTAWRPLLEDSNTVEIFWDIYKKFDNYKGKALAMEVLVQLASVRRSLFSGEEEKVAYLSKFIDGQIDVLEKEIGFNNSECYHNYCRLLPRLKTNYQLTEFIQCAHYNAWLELLAKFTLKSFEQWESASPSIYYILSLWMKFVISSPYLRTTRNEDDRLHLYVPDITRQFILTRLRLAKGVVEGEGIYENPLEHEESLFEQMEAFSQLAHYNFEVTMKTFIEAFDPIYMQYRECLRTNASEKDLEICEGQLSWLCYLFGAVLGRKQHSNETRMKESYIGDAELSARVVRVMALIGERLKMPGAYESETVQRLELGTLKFLKQFKSIYLTDTKMNHTEFYERFKVLIHVDSELKCLNIVLTKIANNLKIWAKCEKIIRKTLKLFESVTTDHSTSVMACKLESTQFILDNHSPKEFNFLSEPANLRHRVQFYKILTRVLFNRDQTEESFIAFLEPLNEVCMRFSQISPMELTTPPVRFALSGFFRDLRGVCWACNTKETYGYLFDWLYPRRIGLLMLVVQACYQYHDVMVPMLQFLCEFVLNRSHRQKFGTSSPYGIILFKELSKVLVEYGRKIPTLNIPPDKEYEMRYKPISLSVLALIRAMSGDYCNFGVFELYNDPALTDALDIYIRLILKISPADIRSYPKLKANFFGLVEVLFTNFLPHILKFDPSIFTQLVASMEYGIIDEDSSISTGVCSAINNLCSYYVSNVKTKRTPGGERLLSLLRESSSVFHRILSRFFRLMMYEECSNQWSISRAMLSVIVIDPEFYEQLRNEIIKSIPDEERRAKLQEAFVELMKCVDFTLTSENKDTFTSNMIAFRNTCKAIL